MLTPLLNAAVYYLIFGIILDTSRGSPNFLAFLITGIFIFNFTQRAFITTSRVMPDSLPLIRALPFPRAACRIGYVLIELEQLVMSMVVLTAIVLVTGEPLTWYWLLALPALALQTVFNIGMGLILARVGAGADDFSQLLPFLVRTWLYASGVMFSIQTIGSLRHHQTIDDLLQFNPAAVYIEPDAERDPAVAADRLARQQAVQRGIGPLPIPGKAYLECQRLLLLLVPRKAAVAEASAGRSWRWWSGFVLFWQAETRYGRG